MEKNNNQTKLWLVSCLTLVIVVVALLVRQNQPGQYDELAQCLKDKGAVFYGAFWCPHCQNQKTMFGNSAKLLPYVECSTPDGRGKLPICEEKNIEGYPTWDFPDGTRQTGEISPNTLAQKTGCPLPAQTQ